MNYTIVINKDTYKIIEKTATDESCWEFVGDYGGKPVIGVVAKTYEICIKKLTRKMKKEVADLKKQLKIAEKNLEKFKKEVE